MNDIEKYIYDNYQNKTSKEISQQINLPFYKVRYIIRKLKLNKKTKETLIKEYIINNDIKKINITELSKKTNISKSRCYKAIKNMDIETNHPLHNVDSINHDYFSNENIKLYPERFVIIGFIAADGCLYQVKNSKSLIFNLSKKDKVCLDIINLELSKGTRKLRNQEKTNSFYLDFPSCQIFDDLYKYNITPRKTSIIDLPKLEIEQMRYYLRGLFYGDGNIYLNKNSKRYSIICNNTFGNSLKSYSDIHISYCCMSKLKNNPGYCQLVWQGKHAIGFENFIFNNDKLILLTRKHI